MQAKDPMAVRRLAAPGSRARMCGAASARARATPSRGFTLVEMLVALAVVGVLVSLAVPAYRNYRDRADTARAVMDIGNISAQVIKFQLDNRALPESLAEIGLDRLLDPWERPYQYVNHDAPHSRGRWRRDKNIVPINSDFDVFSMGKDGASRPPLTAAVSRDDIVRANDGAFIGLASDYDP
jgi:general secretion pathway protein G